ncbi:MAG: hypothetical protein MMC23_008882 [Stictis urceolatum]|nr:hypothetical protein [Stictis urceolata]
MASSNEEAVLGFRRESERGGERNRTLLPSSPSPKAQSTTSDDDENTTALGVPDPAPFTPQPNVFTHPPSSRTPSSTNPASYFTHSNASVRVSHAATSTPPTSQSSGRQSYLRSHTRMRSHTPYNLISPNHSVPIDHDAALRASLSTLLSCAAAARGLPKRENAQVSSNYTTPPPLPSRSPISNRIDQRTLRLIPESSLDATDASTSPPLPRRPSQRSSSSDSQSRTKRKSKSPSHDNRRKRRTGAQPFEEELKTVSPTLMTWVAGVGVVVLFSAISFSAGYALGKEVGRVEAMGAGGLGCGASEADAGFGRGLRGKAWRWGGNASGVRA